MLSEFSFSLLLCSYFSGTQPWHILFLAPSGQSGQTAGDLGKRGPGTMLEIRVCQAESKAESN